MENIVVLGSTGSIGQNTLDIISRTDKFKLTAISFNTNIKVAKKQIEAFKPQYVCCGTKQIADQIKETFKDLTVVYGKDGIMQISSLGDSDIYVNALVGTSGLIPTYNILKSKKKIALANKESLVIAGNIFTKMAKEAGIEITPIDSEHSAIYQCIEGRNKEDIENIILTASGGPFLNRQDLNNITVEDALKHPTWSMGNKITIDSATMMNKGFETIEAKWLFDIDYRKIKILIHKESIMHSAVEFKDGSIIAQLSAHDMRIPIAYALTKPKRMELECKISLADIGSLNFQKPDFDKFPTLSLAYYALEKEDNNIGLILNAADEVLIETFLKRKIQFIHIFDILKKAVDLFEDSLPKDIFAIEKETIYIKAEIKKMIEKEFTGG